MQLYFPFTLLLGSIFCALVDAAPADRAAGRVSVPLSPVRQTRSDLPASILLQQHLNTANKRHARARGLPIPSDAELAAALHRRVEALPEEHYNQLARRYSRVGVPGRAGSSSAVSDALADANTNARTGGNGTTRHRNGHKGKTAGAAAAGAGAGAVAGAAAGAAGAADTTKSTVSAVDSATASATDVASATDSATASATATGASVSDSATGSATAAASSSAAGAASTGNPNAQGFSPVAAAAQKDDSLTVSNDPKTKGQLALDIEANDVGYAATVQLGTPPRDFRVIMDSGSADFWVGAESCATVTLSQQRRDLSARQTGSVDCGNHTFLGSTTSSTFKDTGKQFQVVYGSGAAAGAIIQDTLSFAGLTLKAHTFGAADQETVQFSGDPNIDGLMGLALSTLSNQGVPTPPESLASAGLISNAIVSYRIPRLLDGKKDGVVSFGGIDANTVDKSTLVTVDNVSKVGFWETAVTFSVNGKDSGLKGRTAIMDTGTTLIIAPDADATALHALIPGAGGDATNGFTVPCTTDAVVALTVGGQTFPIDARDLLFAPANNNDLKGDCVSGIQAGTVGGATEWLVGDVFLKNVIFAHDAKANTISLAKVAA